MPNSTFFVYDHQFGWSYNLEKNSVRKEETRAENRIKKEATQPLLLIGSKWKDWYFLVKSFQRSINCKLSFLDCDEMWRPRSSSIVNFPFSILNRLADSIPERRLFFTHALALSWRCLLSIRTHIHICMRALSRASFFHEKPLMKTNSREQPTMR